MNDSLSSRFARFDLNLKEALLLIFLPAFILLELVLGLVFHFSGGIDLGTFIKMQIVFIGPAILIAGLIGTALYLWLPRGIRVICVRELASFFNSPIAYVCVVVFAAVTSLLAFTLGNLIEYQNASLTYSFFFFIPMIFMVIGPAIGMRLWSEEHRQGTIELLSTMPIATWHAIIGKFLASCVVIFVALFCTWPAVVTMEILGDPDWGPMWTGYLGSFLIGMATLGITSLVSAFTRSQVVAFLVSMIICVLFVFTGLPMIADIAGVLPGFDWLLTNFSFWDHFEEIKKGLVTIWSLFYFLILTAFCIVATAVVLRARSRAAVVELILATLAILLFVLTAYFLINRMWIAWLIALLPLLGLGYYIYERVTKGGKAAQDGIFAGVGLSLIAAIGIVVYIGTTFLPIRFDFTEHDIYTLSDGTKRIVEDLDSPVRIRYFVTEGRENMSPTERQFAQKVEDLLIEYSKIGSNVDFEKIDVQIPSDEEDDAQEAGLSAVDGEEGEIYFGIVVTALDKKELIEFSNPALEDQSGREQRLEYELTSAITRVYDPSYTLDLVEAAAAEELPKSGTAKVIVADVDGKLHFRVFDTKGRMVADRSEDDLPIANLRYTGEIKRILGDPIPLTDELTESDQEEVIGLVNSAVGHVPGKANVTVMTSVPIAGSNPMMMGMPGQQGGSPPWFLHSQLEFDYNLTMISTSPNEPIDPNSTDILIVLHPYDITEEGEYAIDQYLLAGGTVVAIVDPLFASAEAMGPPPQPGMPPGMNPGAPGPSSELPTLFDKWGIEYSSSQVVADRTYQTMIQTGQRMPTFLSLSEDAMNRENVVTTQLTDMNLLFAGGFTLNKEKRSRSIKVEPLLTSSKDTQLVSGFEAQTVSQIDSVQDDFTRSGKQYYFAMRMTGDAWETAFPGGDPNAVPDLEGLDGEEDGDEDSAAAEDEAASEDAGDSLLKSVKPGTVVLISDCDFIFDQWCVRIARDPQTGRPRIEPINHNLPFIQNLTEYLTGSEDLISIRGRSSSNRPFTLLNKMVAEAREETNAQIDEFRKEEEKAREELEAYVAEQAAKTEDQVIFVDPRDLPGHDKRVEKVRQIERQIREIEKERERKIDRKITWIKFLNIVPMAALVALIGLLCWVARVVRTAAR